MFSTRSLPESAVYEILGNPRRRQAIRHLTDTAGGRTVSLRALSTAIAAAETGESPPPRAARESVYNSLQQTHLPKLHELGIVEYDTAARTVRIRDSAREIDRCLGVASPDGFPWAEYYRLLGIVSLLAVVAALAEVPLVSAVDPLLWASAFLLVFALSVGAQLWSIRWYIRQLIA